MLFLHSRLYEWGLEVGYFNRPLFTSPLFNSWLFFENGLKSILNYYSEELLNPKCPALSV